MGKMAKGGRYFFWFVMLFLWAGNILSNTDKEIQKQNVISLLEQGKAQAAVDTLNNMRLQSLEDPELYFLLGKANFGIQDFKNAEVAFKMALYFKNAYPEAQFELGITKLKRNFPNEALYFFDQAVKLKPEWDEARRKLGECFFLVQRYEPALDAFNQLIKKSKQDYKSYYYVGKIRKAQNLIDAAVWNLQTAISIMPDYIPALQLLSEIYLESERPDDALFLFDKILQSAPDSLKNNEIVAELFLQRGKNKLQIDSLTPAINDLRNVQLIFPEHEESAQLIKEIQRKTNFDSLMACANNALQEQELEDAQLLFTQALLLAKVAGEEDTVTVYLDSLSTILSERKYEIELSTLYEKAEEAFAAGDYEQALSLYQKIVILNPTDHLSEVAFKESGSLKYFIRAIQEWNNENWEAALKSFEQVIAYYPNFPKIKAKRQALQHIKQLESQQIIVRKALENGGYTTAKDLFFKVFHANPKNAKLSEMWFQIRALGERLRYKNYLRWFSYFFVGLVLLLFIFLITLKRREAQDLYYWKIAGLLFLLICPTILMVGGIVFTSNLQKPTEVEFQVTADHASFFLEPHQDFELTIVSDSINFTQINQLSLEKVQLCSESDSIFRELTEPLTFLADTLKEPLAFQARTERTPLSLANCRFNCPAKVVLRPGQQETGVTLVPHPILKNYTSWLEGELRLNTPFQVTVPYFKNSLTDSTKGSSHPAPGNYWGKPLTDKPGFAQMEIQGPHFQLNYSQPGKLKFQQVPICDLSFKRFLPGDGTIQTIDGFRNANLSIFTGSSSTQKIKIKEKFNVFPNRFMLQHVENKHGKIVLALTGLLTSFQVNSNNSDSKELIPNYFTWYWKNSTWLLIALGIFWIVNTLCCIALLVRYFQQRQNEALNFHTPTADLGALPIDQMIKNIHENWIQNLNQLILPKWQEKIAQIQERLENEKDQTSKDALVALLHRSEDIYKERKNELDKITSGENNG